MKIQAGSDSKIYMEMQMFETRQDTLRKGDDLFQSWAIHLVWDQH